ncbi:ribosome maturation factor RimP [Acetobacterium wieringae]|jgi:ribosome maturation factor RimP|uniref:Ribosome maturation factor RimP n=1 Tax=Acetobacterium wieringae TaxID=52694 RepID=A0A1F2PES1_9FIRM|nr:MULTISPECIES: ribosome maturation factor RimP [Acetobacterium]MEA4804829.1 ribosome maturation factor RimP [Acetobacterium wieringae]OFV69484.1 ribosome maturation factor RimP [Acetobacterium wieringae]OXS26222.1 MAG: ribosome maturation factor RimP [Acetobacterium sp. MES1]URN86078.1 ribosome maturation factor RimP [Acetobacterium wieringae]UYO64601.1 ribosome maturation factor RimP [Acetobacterium wieringae]
MKKVSKEFLLEELAAPVVESLGYELTDLTFEKKGKDWYLTLFIDSENGISLEDCEKVSRPVSEMLDEQDPIEQSYFLEVSSPGMDRPLKKEKHFLSNLDKKIAVHLFAPMDGKKDIEGVLKSYTTDELTLELETGELLTLENSKIAKANRLDELNFKPLPSAE